MQDKPSPYLWTRLEEQIREYEQNPVRFYFNYTGKRIAFVLRPAVMAVLLFVSVIAGYSGGDVLSKDAGSEISETFYLDKLESQFVEEEYLWAKNGC